MTPTPGSTWTPPIYIAGALGVTRDNITWKEANADQRQQLLESGGADLIVSTFSITDQRKQVVDFAGPYFVAHQDLLVRRNDTEITGPEALDGKTLCSVPGTTSAAYVTSHFLGNIKLLEKPRFSDCVTALANSEVDAVTTDDVILAGLRRPTPVPRQAEGRRARASPTRSTASG